MNVPLIHDELLKIILEPLCGLQQPKIVLHGYRPPVKKKKKNVKTIIIIIHHSTNLINCTLTASLSFCNNSINVSQSNMEGLRP